MTLKEAVGVTSCHVDIKTGKELPHDEFYGRVVELLGGAEKVGEYIPVPLDEIREKVEKDRNLNNIPLNVWNGAAGFTREVPLNGPQRGTPVLKPTGYGLWTLLQAHGINTMSPAQGVCILKYAARALV